MRNIYWAIPAGGAITPEMWKHIASSALHKMQVNLWNFEVKVGEAGVEVFSESFKLGRFNSQGSEGWKVNKTHPTNSAGRPRGKLIEEGMLKDSIVYRIRRDYGPDKIMFRTDPKFYCLKGERKEDEGVRSIMYAKVHNEGAVTSHGTYPRRQFMPADPDTGAEGSSTVMDERMEALEALIFAGIPATKIGL